MRIDAHQHFWRYEPVEFAWIGEGMETIRRDFLPDELEPHLNALAMDGCVAVQACQTLDENQFLLDLADRHPFIKGVVGWVDLQSPEVGIELDRWARHPRFKGVRHIVQGESDDRFLLRPAFLEGIAQLAPRNLAYDILIFPKHLPVATEFAARFPDQRFVLDHLAKPPIASGALELWATDLRRLAQLPNVFCKLSGMVTEATWNGWTVDDLAPYVHTVLEAFGPDRTMIGSDWPVCLVAAETYRETVGATLALLPPDARRAVLGETAARFYQL